MGTEQKPIVFDKGDSWSQDEITQMFLRCALPDASIREPIAHLLKQNNIRITNVAGLLSTLRTILRDSLNWSAKVLDKNVVKAIAQLEQYESTVRESWEAFSDEGKPNPQAIYWPNIERDPAQDISKILPVVKNLGWVNPQTKIGSAGSCFASEIAFSLQKRKFNYFIAEKMHRPEEGVFASDIDPKTGFQGACANWGILFNTPSFAQLAEVAFGERKLQQILIRQDGIDNKGGEVYTFPFRENVYFASVESFEKDYPKHLEAVRRTFTECEVFCITLGLNEAWQFMDDGTFMSRNPRLKLSNALVKHRVLTLEENIQNVQRFIDLISAHNKKMKFIITVSPVPLLATGRGKDMHVITANGHSKATLRVTAEEICRKNPHCQYFPSYEVIMHCTQNAWLPDARHVSPEGVQRVMQTFDAMFVSA